MNKPTFAQMAHFYRLVEEGKITAEIFQSFLENPSEFFDKNGFPATIDYSKSLSDMLASSGLYHSDRHIVAKNFPIIGTGISHVKLRLTNVDLITVSEKIVEGIAELNRELARIEHLVAFVTKYPHKLCRNSLIYALGSMWFDSVSGCNTVPFASKVANERIVIDLCWHTVNPGCRSAYAANSRFLTVDRPATGF